MNRCLTVSILLIKSNVRPTDLSWAIDGNQSFQYWQAPSDTKDGQIILNQMEKSFRKTSAMATQPLSPKKTENYRSPASDSYGMTS